MITLTFINGECDYDNHIIIFFETLRNHVEDFGYSAKIDLRGIEIKKAEFNYILKLCEICIKTDYMYELTYDERREEIENYLGFFMKNNMECPVMEYCAKNGLLEIMEYAYNNGCHFTKNTCSYAATFGHIECLKYVHEHGMPMDEQTIMRAAQYGHIECLKYAHEHVCFDKCNPSNEYKYWNRWNNWIMRGCECEQYAKECADYLDLHDIFGKEMNISL